jgi:hypothetical protein
MSVLKLINAIQSYLPLTGDKGENARLVLNELYRLRDRGIVPKKLLNKAIRVQQKIVNGILH